MDIQALGVSDGADGQVGQASSAICNKTQRLRVVADKKASWLLAGHAASYVDLSK